MEKEKKPIYKTLLFWEIVVGAVFILAIVIFMAAELRKPLPEIPETTGEPLPTASEETEATEETLPPPESNPIGLGDFAMEGDYLSCLTAPSVLGIDVSFWQGTVDWQKVKDAGVEFVIIRAG